jgi:cytochrome oxidase Cu insertion factor (SCO1/SenC/PrrC family)
VTSAFAETTGAKASAVIQKRKQAAHRARVEQYRSGERVAAKEALRHTAIIYLMNKDGRFVTRFSLKRSAEDAADDLRRFL